MHEITRPEALAIKNADTLCFDHLRDGTGRIRAIRRADNSSDGFEQTVEVEATRSSVQNYGPNPDDRTFVAYHSEMSAKYSDTVRTIVRHLRPGAQFALRWTRDNSSPVTREAGLVVDELRIVIQRGKVTDTLLVRTSVCLDNSARMVTVAR